MKGGLLTRNLARGGDVIERAARYPRHRTVPRPTSVPRREVLEMKPPVGGFDQGAAVQFRMQPHTYTPRPVTSLMTTTITTMTKITWMRPPPT